jgi:hypothetical protein
VSIVQHLACTDTQILAHCQHCAAPCLLRYKGTCLLSTLCNTLLAQIHRYLPNVSTVQHHASSCTQVLVHCQQCAAHCLLRYTVTCPMSALCSTLLAQVCRYLPTVSTVQHFACSDTEIFTHCQHCALHGLLRYTGTCPLSALCSILLAQIHRYLPIVSTVQHLACSDRQILVLCQHCATHCFLTYTGTCPRSALCITLLAQINRYLPTVITVQNLACSDIQVLAQCQHCAAPCLIRYTDICPLSAMCSTLLAQVHRYLPTD